MGRVLRRRCSSRRVQLDPPRNCLWTFRCKSVCVCVIFFSTSARSVLLFFFPNTPRIRLETNKSSVMRRFGIQILCIRTRHNSQQRNVPSCTDGALDAYFDCRDIRLVAIYLHFYYFAGEFTSLLRRQKKNSAAHDLTHTLAPTSKFIESSAMSRRWANKVKTKTRTTKVWHYVVALATNAKTTPHSCHVCVWLCVGIDDVTKLRNKSLAENYITSAQTETDRKTMPTNDG